MKTVEERLKFLEARLRRYQGLTIIIGVVLVALVTISATPTIPDVIKARKFEVVNPQGVTVATLKSWELGGWLDIRNNEGNITTNINQSDDGIGAIGIYSKGENDLITIGSGNLAGIIQVYSKEGKNLIFIGSDEGGDGLIRVKSREGKGRIFLGTNKSETGGYVVVTNKIGEGVITLQVDEYGNGEVRAWNRKGKGRTLKPGPHQD